jgi:uncharacterized tellurite resistance protein B-like protein
LPRHWKGREPLSEWNPDDVVSEAELLNRVILAKALVVHASNKPALLKTVKEEFDITPKVAEDIMRAAGFFDKKRIKPDS